MPRLGPISRQEVNHRRQVKDRLQLWDDKHSSIKTAHKVLQDKKEVLKFEQERKLEEARREVSQDPCSLARYDIVIAQAMKFGYTLGTLEAGCDCEYKKEEEIERLRHEEVERKYGFSVPLAPQNIVRSMDPSPSPDPPSPSPEGGGIEPERTINKKRSRNSHHKQGVPKRRRLPTGAPPDHDEPEPDAGSGASPEPSPSLEPDTQTTSDAENEGRAAPVLCGISERTIAFEQVYQDGHAVRKHRIASYGDKWYIFRCDTHDTPFATKNPVKGATKHLANTYNQIGQRVSQKEAIELMRVEVLNCDLQKQCLNNEAVDRDLNKGPRPGGTTRHHSTESQGEQQQLTTGNARSRGAHDSSRAVESPVPGEIYLANLGERGTLAVIVLPRDGFGDPSFSDVGLQGTSLANDTDLLDNVPDCYRTCKDTGRTTITGWQDGYEDGGDKTAQRKYPVMRFDGARGPHRNSVEWVRTGDLLTYAPTARADNRAIISNFAHLEQFEKQRQMASTAGQARVQQDQGPHTQHQLQTTNRNLATRNPANKEDLTQTPSTPRHLPRPELPRFSTHGRTLTLDPAQLHRGMGDSGRTQGSTVHEGLNMSAYRCPEAMMIPGGGEQAVELNDGDTEEGVLE